MKHAHNLVLILTLFGLSPVSEARDRFLLLDARIIEASTNARLTLGEVKKDPRNPLFGEDKPWEPRFDNLYANVMYDEETKLYRCWYSPFIIDERTTLTPVEKRPSIKYLEAKPNHREMGVCYAESEDGIQWEKPELGLVEFDGNKENNIVFREPHGAGVFRDARETDPDKLFKMVSKHDDAMSVAFSPDGLRWSESVPCPEIDAAGDTHNNALWNPVLNKYTFITRMWDWDRGMRLVGWTESDDFVKWTKAKEVLRGLEKHLHTYAIPVFWHGGIFIGLPAIFNSESDRTHTELAWSEDTVTWHRVNPGVPLIANSETKGDYDWGCVYTSAYPVFHDDEIRLYYGGSDYEHTTWRKGFLCLATLRPDGFAGYEPDCADNTGSITTKPLPFDGRDIQISSDVLPGGSVRVEVLDVKGGVLSRSTPIKETVTDESLKWEGDSSWGESEIRLRLVLDRAKVYSFVLCE